jgi:hypothetical protein
MKHFPIIIASCLIAGGAAAASKFEPMVGESATKAAWRVIERQFNPVDCPAIGEAIYADEEDAIFALCTNGEIFLVVDVGLTYRGMKAVAIRCSALPSVCRGASSEEFEADWANLVKRIERSIERSQAKPDDAQLGCLPSSRHCTEIKPKNE